MTLRHEGQSYRTTLTHKPETFVTSYKTAAEILAEQTSPEELQRRLWELEEQVERLRSWIQAHEDVPHRWGDRK